MMRALLKLFPPHWRGRYGDDFFDHLRSDPRRVTKWVDAVYTAAGLRWRTFRGSGEGLAVGLVGALTLTLSCDLAGGVGMDERIGVHLLEHWWGAPFAAVLAIGAAMATGALFAILCDTHRRRSAIMLIAGMVAGSSAGSALLAIVSVDLAAFGAGVGLVVAVATARAFVHTPLGRCDGLLVAAVPMILILGWRTASSPLGPLILLVVAGALVATCTRPHAQVV